MGRPANPMLPSPVAFGGSAIGRAKGVHHAQRDGSVPVTEALYAALAILVAGKALAIFRYHRESQIRLVNAWAECLRALAEAKRTDAAAEKAKRLHAGKRPALNGPQAEDPTVR